MKPEPGMALGSRYKLESLIAIGGMGEVWVAHDDMLARNVAVKVLREEFNGDSDFLERFRAEARNTAALSHAGIASLFDYGEEDGTGYLVMELVDSDPLSEILERDTTVELELTLSILAQTARALHAAHSAGVIHRDVKPGNILLRPDGSVKITDFGISKLANTVSITAEGMVMGTAQYLSPEQASGFRATASSDLYALGIVGYEMLVGHRPFTGTTPLEIALAHVDQAVPPMPDTVPEDVAELIYAMLAKMPSERPRTALALARWLDRLAAAHDNPDSDTGGVRRVKTVGPVPLVGTFAAGVADEMRPKNSTTSSSASDSGATDERSADEASGSTSTSSTSGATSGSPPLAQASAPSPATTGDTQQRPATGAQEPIAAAPASDASSGAGAGSTKSGAQPSHPVAKVPLDGGQGGPAYSAAPSAAPEAASASQSTPTAFPEPTVPFRRIRRPQQPPARQAPIPMPTPKPATKTKGRKSAGSVKSSKNDISGSQSGTTSHAQQQPAPVSHNPLANSHKTPESVLKPSLFQQTWFLAAITLLIFAIIGGACAFALFSGGGEPSGLETRIGATLSVDAPTYPQT